MASPLQFGLLLCTGLWILIYTIRVWIVDPPYANPFWSQFLAYAFLFICVSLVVFETIRHIRHLTQARVWDQQMKGLIVSLQQYKRRCANPAVSDDCRFSEASYIYRCILVRDLLSLAKEKADEYALLRDQLTDHWGPICRNMNTQLDELKSRGKATYQVRLMSSYGAQMHLHTDSDIDFGILVESLTPTLARLIGRALTKDLHFQFIRHQTTTKNELFIYQKVVDGVTIEVKIRDAKDSAPFLHLHRNMEMLPKNTKRAIALLKQTLKELEKTDPTQVGVYDAFKLVVYHAHMVDVPGRLAFRV